MSDIDVGPLGEDDWEVYRAIRLAALSESPEAFVGTHDEEQEYPESLWRERMRRSTRLLAQRDGRPVGVLSLGRVGPPERQVAEVFGLWVHPAARGTGVASRLLEAAADQARRDDETHLAYWVGTENGRAVAFASGIGFRPTDFRRPLRVVSEDDGGEEIAMVLPLGADRGVTPPL